MNPLLLYRLVRGVVRVIISGGNRQAQRERAETIHRRVRGEPITTRDERTVNLESRRAVDRGKQLGTATPTPAGSLLSDRPSAGSRGGLPAGSTEITEVVVKWFDGTGAQHSSMVVLRGTQGLSPNEIHERAREAVLNGPSGRDRVSGDESIVPVEVRSTQAIAVYVVEV